MSFIPSRIDPKAWIVSLNRIFKRFYIFCCYTSDKRTYFGIHIIASNVMKSLASPSKLDFSRNHYLQSTRSSFSGHKIMAIFYSKVQNTMNNPSRGDLKNLLVVFFISTSNGEYCDQIGIQGVLHSKE